jgi:hypothetical protein
MSIPVLIVAIISKRHATVIYTVSVMVTVSVNVRNVVLTISNLIFARVNGALYAVVTVNWGTGKTAPANMTALLAVAEDPVIATCVVNAAKAKNTGSTNAGVFGADVAIVTISVCGT